MDPAELEYLVGEFVRTVARRLRIPNGGLRFVEEIRDVVKSQDAVVSERLEGFINAYWQWSDFHRRVRAQQQEGKLSEDQQRQLDHLMQLRDTSRDALLAVLPPEA